MSKRHHSHMIWCEWHPQDIALRGRLKMRRASCGYSLNHLTHILWTVLNTGIVPGHPGKERNDTACRRPLWGTIHVLVDSWNIVCRDHKSLSETLRGSVLPWCSTPFIMSPVLFTPTLPQPLATRNLCCCVLEMCLGLILHQTLLRLESCIAKIQTNLNNPYCHLCGGALMGSTYHLFQPVVITFSIELGNTLCLSFMMLQAISEYFVQAFIKNVIETQR